MWFLEETDSDKALTYLENFVKSHYVLIIPTLLFYELGNKFVTADRPLFDRLKKVFSNITLLSQVVS